MARRLRGIEIIEDGADRPAKLTERARQILARKPGDPPLEPLVHGPAILKVGHQPRLSRFARRERGAHLVDLGIRRTVSPLLHVVQRQPHQVCDVERVGGGQRGPQRLAQFTAEHPQQRSFAHSPK
jgi:hypothetical protein